MTQTKRMSIAETLTSTSLGFVGSWIIGYFCVTGIQDRVDAVTVTTIGCTVWSIARGYCVRRVFNGAWRRK